MDLSRPAECKKVVKGQDALIDALYTRISDFVEHENRRYEMGYDNVLGILLEGFTGVGKMYLAQSIASTSGLSWSFVNIQDIFTSSLADLPSTILGKFKDETCRIYVIELVDSLLGKSSAEADEYEKTLQASMELVFERLSQRNTASIVIGVTDRLDLIDPTWLLGTRFSLVQHVSVSKTEQRLDILDHMFTGKAKMEDLSEFCKILHGYTVADLGAIVYVCRKEMDITLKVLMAAKEQVMPSMMSELNNRPPNKNLNELVGMDDQIEYLRGMLLDPIKSPELCEKYNLTLPKGILIHGETGTGKTHLALGLISAAGLNFIPVDSSSIRSKYVGQSEKNLAAVFQKARECAPSILLLDHIEALVSKRSAESTTTDNSGNRLVTCFLTEMDGLMRKGTNDRVVVIGITDRIEKLDPAMIRPGRLGIHVQTPSILDEASRRQFFRASRIPIFLDDSELGVLMEITKGKTGADIDLLCQNAARLALEEGRVLFTHFQMVLNNCL